MAHSWLISSTTPVINTRQQLLPTGYNNHVRKTTSRCFSVPHVATHPPPAQWFRLAEPGQRRPFTFLAPARMLIMVSVSVSQHHTSWSTLQQKKKKEDSTRHRHTNGKPSFTFRDDIYIIFFFHKPYHIVQRQDPSAESITQPRNEDPKICWSRWDTHDILCII